MRAPRGLQFEIVASLFIVLLAGFAIVALVMTALAARSVERAALAQLESDAVLLERMKQVGSLRLPDLAALVAVLAGKETRWSVADGHGRLLGAHSGALELAPQVKAALARGERVHRGGVFGPDLELIAPLPLSRHGGQPGLLIGRVPVSELQLRLAPLLRSGAWVLASSAAAFVFFGSYLLRRRIVRRVQFLGEAVGQVAAGDLSARTAVSGSDELADLASGFNEMAASLERERHALLRTQDSLHRSQRLATVGQLAAGVAHEVGNPVAAVLNYSELLLRDAELGSRSRESAEQIRAEALRVRSLVRDLLDLARSEQAAVRHHNPVELLERIATRMSAQPLLAHVELVTQLDADLPAIDTDARRVEQILINLIENAAHALVGTQDPRIELIATIGASARLSRRRDDPPEGGFGDVRTPDAVQLRVIDNGPGVDLESQEYVFDPFFTTKEPGEGTGLGLWNAHRLAELLGGRLELESAPGRTAFTLVLPAADTAEDAPRPDHR